MAPSAPHKPQLVCPAGSLRALTLAIDAGADAVYMGLKDATNARNFAGLNFDLAQAREGIAYAHARGRHAQVVHRIADLALRTALVALADRVAGGRVRAALLAAGAALLLPAPGETPSRL